MTHSKCFLCLEEFNEEEAELEEDYSDFVINHILEIPNWKSITKRSNLQTVYCPPCKQKIKEILQILQDLTNLEKLVLERKSGIEVQLRESLQKGQSSWNESDDALLHFRKILVSELNSTQLCSTLTKVKENRVGKKYYHSTTGLGQRGGQDRGHKRKYVPSLEQDTNRDLGNHFILSDINLEPNSQLAECVETIYSNEEQEDEDSLSKTEEFPEEYLYPEVKFNPDEEEKVRIHSLPSTSNSILMQNLDDGIGIDDLYYEESEPLDVKSNNSDDDSDLPCDFLSPRIKYKDESTASTAHNSTNRSSIQTCYPTIKVSIPRSRSKASETSGNKQQTQRMKITWVFKRSFKTAEEADAYMALAWCKNYKSNAGSVAYYCKLHGRTCNARSKLKHQSLTGNGLVHYYENSDFKHSPNGRKGRLKTNSYFQRTTV